MNELITVIIPAYNVFSYLDHCMQSVLHQTYTNLEIILIDDGSDDGTGELCNSYAIKDNRVKVIHKQNMGLADTRNVGIKEAHGTYLAFIDSDDFVTEDYIEYLYNLLIENDADISACAFKRVWNYENVKNNKINNAQKKIFNAESAIENLCYMKDLIVGAYCKLYKKEIWDDLRFPVGYIYEDLAIMYKLFSNASVIVYENMEKYFYFQRQGSILHSNFNIGILSRVKFADEIEDYVSKNYPDIIKSAKCRKFWSNAGALMDLPWSDKYKSYYDEIKKNIRACRRTVLFDTRAKLSIRIMALSSYLGIVPLKVLGSLYKRLNK